MKPELPQQIFEKYWLIKFQKKTCPVGAELFHVDGQTDGETDMRKLIVAFRKFSKDPKKRNSNMLIVLLFCFLHQTRKIALTRSPCLPCLCLAACLSVPVKTGISDFETVERFSWYLYELHVIGSHHKRRSNAMLLFFYFWGNGPPVGQGLLIHEVSRSHTTTHHSQ